MAHGQQLTLSVECGDLYKKPELHLGSNVFRVSKEGNDVCKAVF